MSHKLNFLNTDKSLLRFLLILFFFAAQGVAWGQVDLVKWETANFTPSYEASHITASNITGTGITLTPETWSETFFQAGNWPTGGINISKYVEFTISPDAGYKINLDKFNFYYRAQTADGQRFQVRYSKNNFASYTTMIGETSTPGSWTSASNGFSSVSPILPGETLKIRIYVYNTNNNFHILRSGGINYPPTITGTVVSAAPPVVVNDNESTAENTPANFDILANDTYSTLSAITITDQPDHGLNITVNGLTDVTYTPNNGYTGSDSFKYRITDENGISNEATVNITISTPTPPTAVADIVSTIKNHSISSINVLANDSPGSGAFDYVTKVSDPSHGTATINPDNKTFTYTPTTDYSGSDSFQYYVTNVQGLTSNTVTVTINVNSTEDLAIWNNINFTPTTVSNISASNITVAGSGLTLTHKSNSTTDDFFEVNNNWPSGGIDLTKYVEFTISPDAGYKIELDRFNFYYKSQGGQNFQVRYSKNNFASYTTMIGNTSVPGTWTSASNTFSSGSPILPGETLKIRIYAYNTYQVFQIKRYFDTAQPTDFSQSPRITGRVVSLSQADLQITHTVDNDEPVALDNVTFTITAKNNGDDDAQGVIVNDLLPTGLTYVSHSATNGDGTYNQTTGVWTIGNLDDEDEQTLTITATVQSTGNYTNTATISGDDDDPNLSNNSVSVSVDPYFPSADLEITNMTISNPTPTVGSNVTFTIGVINNGDDAASGVVVNALLPSGYQYVSSTPSSGTTYNSSTGVWTIGNMSVTATKSIQITAKVLGTGNYNFTAEIDGAIDDPDSDNNDGSATLTNSVDLGITKAVDVPTPGIGDPVVFTIGVSNGANPATGVVVRDVIPTGYTYVTNSVVAPYDPITKTVTWNVGDLAASATTSFTITATTKASGNHTNTATVSANEPDNVTANNSASASVTPDLDDGINLASSATVDDDAADYGETVTFTITAGNAADQQPATNGTMSILVANGFQVMGTPTTPNGGDVVVSGPDANGETRITWTMGATLPALPNDPPDPAYIPVSETLTITATVLTPAYVDTTYDRESAYIIIADLSADEIDYEIDPINNRAYSVVKPPSLPPVVLADLAIAEGAILTEDFGSGTATFAPPLEEGVTNLNYYAPDPVPGTWPDNYVADNFYTIGHNSDDAFDNWRPLADGSGVENGYFYIANANYDPREFFRFKINFTSGDFCVNTRYVVRFKAADINPENPAYISPEIGYFIQNNDGVILGAGIQELPNQAGGQGVDLVWHEYAFVFTTRNNEDETVDLVMFNNHPGGDGNDLAIDDITVNAFMTPPVRLDMEITETETETQQLEVCGGEDVKLFVKVADSDDYVFPPDSWGGVDYQWQKQLGDGTWTDIGEQGTVSPPDLEEIDPNYTEYITYEIPNFQPEDETYYRLLYSQPGNIDSENCRFISEQLLPVFNATPDIPPIKIEDDGPSYVCGEENIPGGTLGLYTDFDHSAYVDDEGESTWGEDFYLWESSDTAVATIDQNGVVTAVGLGTTTITYTVWSPKKTAACTASVTKDISVLADCPSCVEPPTGDGTDVDSPIGISTYEKQPTGWPENVPNGFIVLESGDKGFVITRVASDTAIAEPKEGMLIYDETEDCIKLYNGSNWHCIEQECDEEP